MVKIQTFLPYADFIKCAAVLDDKRLYKQIVECKQLLNIISYKREGLTHYPKGHKKAGKRIGYLNNPIVKLWYNQDEALRAYQIQMLKEWLKRRWSLKMIDFHDWRYTTLYVYPDWLGDEELHKSHRLNLLFKNPEHYCKYFKEPIPKTKLEYYYPLD